MRTSLSPGQPRPEGSSDVEKALPVLTELNLPATSMEVLAPYGAGPYLALRIFPLLLPGPSVCVGGGGAGAGGGGAGAVGWQVMRTEAMTVA